jgi:hypothetical protein
MAGVMTSDSGDSETRYLGIAFFVVWKSLRFQPYYGFLSGLDGQAWNRLSTSEQRELLKRSKLRKGKRLPVQEEEEPEGGLVIERFSLPTRAITKEELARMPRYQHY